MNNRDTVDTTIELTQDGPMIVCGSFEVTKPDGTKMVFSAQQMLDGVALCRCGRSTNKPLCDGSHKKSNL